LIEFYDSRRDSNAKVLALKKKSQGNNMATGTIISLGLYFVVMLGIGLFAYRQTDTNVEGYMLGGRQLGPAVTALSAGASDMSGWMLMGLPGAM
jgi:SSS family solute:Na+ symporter